MNLSFYTARASSTASPEQAGMGNGIQGLAPRGPAALQDHGDRPSDGADLACEARATSLRERWRLPTAISERELFEAAGLSYGEATA